jgi:long-chain acyl-CoA synthetase
LDKTQTELLQSFTIPQLLRWRVDRTGDKVALREKDFGRWCSYTWNDYYDYVRRAGLGLQKMGLKKDDAIALIGDNIPEMLFTAIGAQAVGGISAAIYQTTMPDEIAQLLDYMNVTMVFCDDQEQVDKIVEIRDRVPQVRHVIYEDPRGMRDYRADPWFVNIEDVFKLGDTVHAENPDLFESLLGEGKADDVCHLCLTSGTTGLSKGTMLTHKNFISMGLQLTDADPLADTDEYVSFLPFAWIGEQMNSLAWPWPRDHHQFSRVGGNGHGRSKGDRPPFHVRRPPDLRDHSVPDLAQD